MGFDYMINESSFGIMHYCMDGDDEDDEGKGTLRDGVGCFVYGS